MYIRMYIYMYVYIYIYIFGRIYTHNINTCSKYAFCVCAC